MEVIIQPTGDAAIGVAARMIARQIRSKPDSVLGLATGSTTIPLYGELVRMHREEGLDFADVTAFTLDEYIGLPPHHPESYHWFMHEHLFRGVNIPESQIYLPDGLTHDVPATCRDHESRIRRVGGIDIQVLGIGSDGHIGFNEPSSSLASRTRIKTLTPQTLRDNARHFRRPEEQPHHAITMGIGTIMESRRVLLLAFGSGKADAVAQSMEGPVTATMPASALQRHPQVHAILDEAAAAKLSHGDYYRWVYENKPDWQCC